MGGNGLYVCLAGSTAGLNQPKKAAHGQCCKDEQKRTPGTTEKTVPGGIFLHCAARDTAQMTAFSPSRTEHPLLSCFLGSLGRGPLLLEFKSGYRNSVYRNVIHCPPRQEHRNIGRTRKPGPDFWFCFFCMPTPVLGGLFPALT